MPSLRFLSFAVLACVACTLVQASVSSESPRSRRLLQSRPPPPRPEPPSVRLPSYLETLLSGRTSTTGTSVEPIVALLWGGGDVDADGVTVERFIGLIQPPEIRRRTGVPVDPTENVRKKHIGGIKYEEISIKVGPTVDRDFLDLEMSSWALGASSRKQDGLDIQTFSWGTCDPAKVVEGPDGKGCTENKWPPPRKSLSIVYLSEGVMDNGQLSFPTLSLDHAVTTSVSFPALDASSRSNEGCSVTMVFASADGSPIQRRQYQPLLVRKRIESAKTLQRVKQKAWLCSNYRVSFDVSEDPLASNIYHPCLGCPPPFFPDLAARKGLNAVNVRMSFAEKSSDVTDESPLEDSDPKPWQVVSDSDFVVPFAGKRSCDFFLKMEQCSARDGANGEPSPLSGNPLSCREAGSGLATGRRQYTPGTRYSREAGSGMATGRRQHAMVVVPSDDGVPLVMHYELQMKAVARAETNFDSMMGGACTSTSEGSAVWSIVGALASTRDPLPMQLPTDAPIPPTH